MEENKVATTNSFAISTMSERATEQLNGIKLELPQLKIPSAGAVFFEIDEEPVKELEGVIVLHGPRFAYFETDFNGESAPPRCSSRGDGTGMWRLDEDLSEEGT